MARKTPKVTILVSGKADVALQEIWNWNAETYSLAHADSYIAFLHKRIASIAGPYSASRPVPTRPDLRYILAVRRPRRYGHVIVYRVVDKAIEVLNIYHSAQEWHAHVLKD
jgi:plasmid stabilization system protein ParE